MLKKYSFIILVLIYTFSYAQEQRGKLEGHIIDAQGKPVYGVHIIIIGTKIGDITDENGHFLIENLPIGNYSLKLSHVAFETKIIENIEITDESIQNLGTIKLEQKIIQFDSFTITATRVEKSIENISAPVNLVTERLITIRNSKTSSEALREETGVFVQKTNHGGGSAIIRGLSSSQILILIDGIRLNNSTYRLGNHQYLTTIDNNAINKIEVVKGPTSVLYGSDALGGTINLITKAQNIFSDTKNFNFNTRIFGRYASADEEKVARTEISLYNNKIAFMGGFSIKDFGDLKRGSVSKHPQLEKSTKGLKQSPSGFKAYDVDSKFIYSVTSSQNFIFAYQMSKQMNVPRYDKYENEGFVKWLYNPQNRTLFYLTYENNLANEYLNSVKASISYHIQEEGREMQKKVTSDIMKESADVRTTGFTFQFNSNYKNNNLIYGSDIYFDKVSSERFTIDVNTKRSKKDLIGLYPDGAIYNSFGVFLQDEIFIRDKLITTLGVRFSYFNTKFKVPFDSTSTVNLGNVNLNFNSLTGSGGILYKLTEKFHLHTNIGQAFRAPNLSDLSKLGESKGNVYEVPNPNLEPEKMISYDAGFRINFDSFKANFSLYYSQITDLLESANATYNGSSTLIRGGDTLKVKAKKNVGKAFIRGFEISTQYNILKNLNFYSGLTYTFGQNETLDEPVGGIPPIFGSAGLKWDDNKYYFDLYARFAGKQDRLSGDDKDDPRIPTGGTPGWQIFNLRTGIKLLKYFYIQFSIENIFDYNYREHGSGINGAGRNFILGLEFKR